MKPIVALLLLLNLLPLRPQDSSETVERSADPPPTEDTSQHENGASRPGEDALRVTPQNEGDVYQEGYASWYGWKFHGRRTASGEIFDMNGLTAAHLQLPFGTLLRVTNSMNDRSVIVKVNDRGPYVEGRIIDLSRAAADAIGMAGSGIAWVSLRVFQEAPPPRYAVQVGAYGDRKNALRTAEKIGSLGLKTSLKGTDGGITRVVVDQVRLEELEDVKERLRSAGFTRLLVKTLPLPDIPIPSIPVPETAVPEDPSVR